MTGPPESPGQSAAVRSPWSNANVRFCQSVLRRFPLEAGLSPRMDLTLTIHRADGSSESVPVLCRVDTADEVDYMLAGGILQYVLRNLAA